MFLRGNRGSWIGDDASLASYKVITSILKNLSEKTNVFVMAGNRDFLLSKKFEKESGIDLRISGMPYIRTLNSQNIIESFIKDRS